MTQIRQDPQRLLWKHTHGVRAWTRLNGFSADQPKQARVLQDLGRARDRKYIQILRDVWESKRSDQQTKFYDRQANTNRAK